MTAGKGKARSIFAIRQLPPTLISVCLAVGLLGAAAEGALAGESSSPQRCRFVYPTPGPNPWSAAQNQLAPGDPTVIRLCRYSGLNDQPGPPRDVLIDSHLITAQKLINRLVRKWDALKRPNPGPEACANDQGRAVVAFLSYPNGRHVTIVTQYSGCEWATNGDVTGTFNRHLWHQLLELTPSPPGHPTW